MILPCFCIPSLAMFLHLPRLAGIAGTTAGYNKAFPFTTHLLLKSLCNFSTALGWINLTENGY